ncbi:hypothetical protein C5167_025590 [Papaver somniferum]|uniref:Uncharacterized protein n=1 Tax=Papaver somniferum TaxID=3469 RepID=A0A4Y7JVV7_PAPSO|nr:uncharacterized protein LOC113278468 [Papaver somniferum]XP_026383081.1 uncharacterized protein LOC113278468 [Papaver somniferum]RZC63845.1 hypothetical protein C5167_025590 [Papaver somniferum]
MENLLVEKMDQREPRSRRPRTLINHKPFDIFDVRSKFVSSVNISAKKIHDLLKLDENQRLSGQFDILDVSLSNTGISISSLANFSSDKINVLVPTNEPITFGVKRRLLSDGLRLMAVGNKVNKIYLAYQPEEEKLTFADAQGQMFLETFPCTKKEISESLVHLNLNNSSGCGE